MGVRDTSDSGRSQDFKADPAMGAGEGEGLELELLGKDHCASDSVPAAPTPAPEVMAKPPAPTKTPIPWRAVLLISTASLTDFIIQTMYLPMYPDICEKFYHADNLGVCVGVLNGMVNLGTALTATMMGFFSDHFGRKLPMLWGLLVGMVAVSVLVTSRSYAFTATMLCVAGMLDPVLPSSKSAIADITDKSNRAGAYGVRATSSAVGRTWWIVLLSATYGSGLVIAGNPFLFAGLAGILSYAVVIVACWFWLPETHPVLGGGPVPKLHLLLKHKNKNETPGGPTETSANPPDEEGGAAEASPPPATQKGQFVMGYRIHEGVAFILLNPVLRQVFLLKFLQTAINSAVQTVLVLYMVLPDRNGGLGLSTETTMYLLVAYFSFGTISLVFVYPRLCARYSVRRVYILYQGQGTVACFLMVFAHAFVRLGGSEIDYSDAFTDIRVTFVLVLALGMQGFALANMPLLQSMLADASDPSLQGLTTGLSQVIIALARSTVGGPLWFGALFSVTAPISAPWVVWLVLGALQAYTVFGMAVMKDHHDATFADWLRERKTKNAKSAHGGFRAMSEREAGESGLQSEPAASEGTMAVDQADGTRPQVA